MRLREYEIDLVARQIVARLLKGAYLEMQDGEAALVERVKKAIADDLVVEDNLNREVEDILKGHMKEIEAGSIDYRRMFAMIKSKLAKDRNLILS